jgi:uncharacterized membrane protein YjjP (DUF1212 family)
MMEIVLVCVRCSGLFQGRQKMPLNGDGSCEFSEKVSCLLLYGDAMLRNGTVSFRVRESIERIGHALGLHQVTLHLAFDSITLTASNDLAKGTRTGETVTSLRRVSGYGINAYRLGALERLGLEAKPGLTPSEVLARLAEIDRTPPLRGNITVILAVALACGAFAYLNQGNPSAMFAAAVGGGIGQGLRMKLLRQSLNQFVVTALCAILASTTYCLVALALARLGLGSLRHASGFVSSVLFLVPGFPLVAAVVDLVQNDLSVGVTRLAYGMMLVFAGGFGICMVAGGVGLSADAPQPWVISGAMATLLWETATFGGACGFSILYNSTWPTVVLVGLLALVGNNLRFGLHHWGMSLAPATFLGAFTVGLLATTVRQVVHEPRIAITVPGIIIMVPGTLAYEAIIHFEKGDVAGAMANALPAGFILGAMAIGLAAARLVSDRAWLHDR